MMMYDAVDVDSSSFFKIQYALNFQWLYIIVSTKSHLYLDLLPIVNIFSGSTKKRQFFILTAPLLFCPQLSLSTRPTCQTPSTREGSLFAAHGNRRRREWHLLAEVRLTGARERWEVSVGPASQRGTTPLEIRV